MITIDSSPGRYGSRFGHAWLSVASDFFKKAKAIARQHHVILAIVVLSASLSFFSALNAAGMPEAEREKIIYLLDEIEHSPFIFVRNGSEFSGAQARTHIQEKWDYAGNRIRTAEDFIRLVASESTLTGTPYYVRLKKGKQIEAASWLRARLEDRQ